MWLERSERNLGVRVEERRIKGGMVCVSVADVYGDE